mmetsp:Transcript_29277/g.66322  ORF Transcript_29277/g.66322 Transcript_29277/m.66322 type:complete len:226 (-) Transcript_29277:291-968(-)
MIVGVSDDLFTGGDEPEAVGLHQSFQLLAAIRIPQRCQPKKTDHLRICQLSSFLLQQPADATCFLHHGHALDLHALLFLPLLVQRQLVSELPAVVESVEQLWVNWTVIAVNEDVRVCCVGCKEWLLLKHIMDSDPPQTRNLGPDTVRSFSVLVSMDAGRCRQDLEQYSVLAQRKPPLYKSFGVHNNMAQVSVSRSHRCVQHLHVVLVINMHQLPLPGQDQPIRQN